MPRRRGVIHVHSTISYDGQQTVAELAAYFRARGFDFVCLAEHSDGLTAADGERLVEEARRHSDERLTLVPGIEFSCRRRLHLLGLGVVALVDSEDPLVVADHVRAHDGVAIVAHPLAYGTDYPEALAERIDGLEVWNITKDGWFGPGAGPLALWRAWRCRNSRLRGFGALDLHVFGSPTGLAVEIEAEGRDARAILDGLRRGPLTLHGRYVSISGLAPPVGVEALGYA
ncbi:MAG: hypothetical protein PVF43_16375, partial [Candidatus Eiseniibacteriota bacterium]